MIRHRDLDQLIAYEEGRMTEPDVIRLFQHLIDSGLVESLQGSYGRMAQALIESGRCTRDRGITSGGPPARRTDKEKSGAG